VNSSLVTGVLRVLLTAWAGATWAVVAWIAPAVFSVVAPEAGRGLAGEMAGHLFRGLAFGGLAAGAVIGALWYRARALDRRSLWVLLVAMAAPLISENFLRPLLEAARAGGQPDASFALLHGASAALYVLASAALGWLVVRRGR
jgi:predicted lipid-binding transport protein (Tim44 family)